jgi:succinate dehydrogenase / fumarate reductase cytochrome b subunit
MSAIERPLVKPRPVYLNLVKIRLPLPGIVSILHRISGAVLFLFAIPLLLAGVGASLASAESFAALKALAAHPLAKLLLLGFAWAYLHHFCAGIRYLLLDLHQGIELAPARQSGVVVLVVSLALTLIVGVRLW